MRGNIPDMTRRINDPRDTIAPELIGCRDENSRSAGGCALEGGIHILDIDVDYDGGAAVGLWGPTGQCREFPVDHDHGRANPDGPTLMAAWITLPSAPDRRESSTALNAVLQNSISAAASRQVSIGITMVTLPGGSSDILVSFQGAGQLQLNQ